VKPFIGNIFVAAPGRWFWVGILAAILYATCVLPTVRYFNLWAPPTVCQEQ
jgi:hypothetical protein